jgi:POLQ-like helicase
MYAAGFKTVGEIAALEPDDLVQSVKNVNRRQAEQIIKAAKHSVIEKIDIQQEQIQEMKNIIQPHRKKSNKNQTST